MPVSGLDMIIANRIEQCNINWLHLRDTDQTFYTFIYFLLSNYQKKRIQSAECGGFNATGAVI